MKKDFHIHAKVLCGGDVDAFISTAVEKGFEQICITDHMPLSISNAADRIPKGKVKEYCAAVREISKRYEDKIDIKCGIEIDYHPSVLSEIETVLGDGDFDYILASSHMHLFTDDFKKYTFNDFAKRALENALLAVNTGWFNTLAHLDMYRFPMVNPDRFPLIPDDYSPDKHMDLIKELLFKIKDKNMCVEVNPHLAKVKNNFALMYPQKEIVQLALATDVQFAYGSDAHLPHSVGDLFDELMQDSVYGRALANW